MVLMGPHPQEEVNFNQLILLKLEVLFYSFYYVLTKLFLGHVHTGSKESF